MRDVLWKKRADARCVVDERCAVEEASEMCCGCEMCSGDEGRVPAYMPCAGIYTDETCDVLCLMCRWMRE